MGFGAASSTLYAKGAAPAVLAFHGFGGVPREVGLVYEVAREISLEASAPLLPGHGTRVAELSRARYEDWSRAAQTELFALESPHVIVVGLSLGSLLAVELAARFPERVTGLCLLANAFFLAPFPAWPLKLVDVLGVPDFRVPKRSSDIRDPTTRPEHVSYDQQPIHAAVEVLRAGERRRLDLYRIHCPTLIVHGALDRLCPKQNAEKVSARLGTSDQRTVILPRSGHIVTEDRDRAVLADELRVFFIRLANRIAA